MNFDEEAAEGIHHHYRSPQSYRTPPPAIWPSTICDPHVCDASGVVDSFGTVHSPSARPPPSSRLAIDLLDDDEDYATCWGQFKLRLSNIWSSLTRFRMFWSLTLVDAKSRKVSYALSFCSVFFVVMLCVAMLSVLSSLPAVFLKLAESNSGDADLVIGPHKYAASLNFSRIREALEIQPSNLHLHAPRIEIEVDAYNFKRCLTKNEHDVWYHASDDEPPLPTSNRCTNTCISDWCPNQTNVNVDLIAFNSALEDKMGLGLKSDFPYPSPVYGGAIVSEEAAKNLRVKVGDDVLLTAEVSKLVVLTNPIPSGTVKRIAMKVNVKQISDRAATKFPSSAYFVAVNYEYFSKMFAEALTPFLEDTVREEIAAMDPEGVATSVYFRMPEKERFDTYVRTSFSSIRARFTGWGNRVVLTLGWSEVTADSPILRFLKTMDYFSMFVGLILSMIILALAFLSIVLIYSLTTVGIETRTYELGIQRMMGFTKENLAFMVLSNAYFYTIPAWILGLAAGQGLYSLLRSILGNQVGITLDRIVSGSSIGWATLAGLLIPLVASFFPIIQLISLSLPAALDASRKGSGGVEYKIKRNDASELNGTMLGMGFIVAMFGFLVYYLFPTSLATLNLSLMFYIFFAVLIGMLAGLVLLATNFQRVIETCVAYIFFFWESKAVFRFMLKSLASHRRRNSKTTLMYALSMAFIIFLTVAFQIQMTALEYQKLREVGAEVYAAFPTRDQQPTPSVLDDAFFNVEPHGAGKEKGDLQFAVVHPANFYFRHYAHTRASLVPLLQSGMVTGITMNGADPVHYLRPLRNIEISTPGRYRTSGSGFIPIPTNFYNVLNDDFLGVNKVSDDAKRYGVSGSLYARDGYRKIIVATTTYNTFGMKGLSDPILLASSEVRNFTAPTNLVYRRQIVQASSVLDTSPSLLMTKFPNNMGQLVASFPAAIRFSGVDYMSVEAIPIKNMKLRVPRTADYDQVMVSLSEAVHSIKYYPGIDSVDSSLKDIREANKLLSLFFIFTQIMILLICFISLMSSMTTNVLGSAKDIAILLCMGTTHAQVYRAYVAEAFILVVSAGVLGLVVGVVVGYTLQLQNVLFTQISLPFPFPYIQLCIVIGIGVISAIASSVSPVAYLLGMPSVTHILRRTT